MKKKLIIFLAAAACVSAMTFPAMAEETAETASETEAVSETETGADAAGETDDIYSFQMDINSVTYAFPMSYEDFTAKGWTSGDDLTEKLNPNYYYIYTFSNEDGLKAYVKIANLGINTAEASNCLIVGIDIDSYFVEDAPDTKIELPGGIVFGTSTADDIQAAYGTPSDIYEGSLYTAYTYQYAYYREVELYIDSETGVLSEINMENMVADEEANAAAAAEVTDDPTEEVLAYEAPEELGDDLLSFIAEYAGDLYQLPAPVSVFEENGWTIDEGSATVVAAHDYDWVYLRKDNQSYHALAKNYGDNAASIHNCFVTEIEGDTYYTEIPITLQKGITLGMTEEELLAALDSVEYELDDSTSESYHYYTIYSEESTLDRIEITVSMEDNTVNNIDVSYSPDELKAAADTESAETEDADGETADKEDTDTNGAETKMTDDETGSADTVSPLPTGIDLENLTDCMIAVSFDEGDAYVDENGTKQLKVTVYAYDLFDMVDIQQLALGSRITICGEDVEITSLEQTEDGSILINGGTDNGGYTMVTDGDTVYYAKEDDDAKLYYELGEVTIPVSSEFEFKDSSDPEKGKVTYSAEEFFKEDADIQYHFVPYNTTIRIENGEAVSMERIYIP